MARRDVWHTPDQPSRVRIVNRRTSRPAEQSVNFRTQFEAESEGNGAAAWYEDRRTVLGDDFLFQLEQAYSSIRNKPFDFPRLEYQLS